MNQLLIMADEYVASALGVSGHALAKTPHLDTLARRGVMFDNAYTPSPMCVPARGAFQTGRYVHAVRCWDNALAYDGDMPVRVEAAPVETAGPPIWPRSAR